MSSQDLHTGALLTIIRGLPGSGKTTKALELYKQGAGLLIEPDACLNIDGVYTYTPERMNIARAILEDAMRALWIRRQHWIERTKLDVPFISIIYADCLPRIDDVFSLIFDTGYVYRTDRVRVIDCIITKEQSIERNIHNVKIEDIERMNNEWEPWSIVQKHGYTYLGVTTPPHSFIE